MSEEMILDQGETKEEETKRSELTGVGHLLREVISKRDAQKMSEFKSLIAGLAAPDEKTVVETKRTEERTIVSRHQPTDRLYERLYQSQPEMKQWRSPDLDHQYKEWILGLVQRDGARRLAAEERMNQIAGTRLTTLEGALDVSDPTAILDGTGGHLLPQPLANVVMIARENANVLPRLVMNVTMNSGTLRIPTANVVTSYMVAEGSVATQGEPTFASEMLKAQKAQAFMKASVEMVADSAFNLMNVYATRAGMSLGALEDTQIATSNGTAPNISEAITGGAVTTATIGTIVYDDLVTLFFALGKSYRPNGVWLGSAATLTGMSQLTDGNGNAVIGFSNSMDARGPVGDVAPVAQIFNRPVYEVPLADGTILWGDVGSGYVFGRRAGITAAVSEHADFASDLVQFKFTERFDGLNVDDAAMKQISGLTTYDAS